MKFKIKDKTSPVSNPSEMYEVLQQVWKKVDVIDREKEHFWVIHLTTRNTVKSLELISVGTLNASLVHPREVFTRAIKEHSCSIVVAHNHPSGVTEPSSEDIQMTRRLVDAGNILGIQVLDHIIYTADSYESLRSRGDM
ncbi:DNA repair protein RadC [Candidatus Roizmanbacteria bacterium]|nr:DNA repair protein RadC [Candidatus Roizmanbacteria bacterium]